MRNIIEELIQAVTFENMNTVYTVITGKGHGEHQYVLGQYGDIDWEDINYQLVNMTDGEYQINSIRYAKNGYGFTYNGTFCHATKLVGSTKKLEDFDSYDLFLIHSIKTEKGNSATWFCPIENIDEKSFNILKKPVLKILEEQSEWHVRRMVADMEAKAEEMLRQRRIKEEVGCGATFKYADNFNQGYQNQYVYVITADDEITYYDVIKIIKIFKGEDALSTERDNPYYTQPINRICTTYNGAIYSGYDDTKATSSQWFWYRHNGTCD